MTLAAALTLESDSRWDKVARRTPADDFVYGVLTTGIYCRSSCPSRRPQSRNVIFYDTSAEAEAAGLRPCRRCTPTADDPQARAAPLVAEACRRIEADIDVGNGLPRLDDLARTAGFSPFHFHRLFRSHTGLTPRAYARARRDARLRSALMQAANVLAVAVPCHRVVRSDGSLSGYRWGVARKRDLLAYESGMPDAG